MRQPHARSMFKFFEGRLVIKLSNEQSVLLFPSSADMIDRGAKSKLLNLFIPPV
jgi:hypothetical protein